MFYSHELLTDRKHGVATIWLVATLGSKSSLRRINRRTIQGVDIERACATVSEPMAPLALRLQSNLLYGISRVYFQQCEYVLTDTQHTEQSLRTLWKMVGTGPLDHLAGKTRPETLIVQDEPGFMPDDAIPDPDFDLRIFDSSAPPSSDPSILSHQSKMSSDSGASILGIEIPSSISNLGPYTVLPSVESTGQDTLPLIGIEDDGFDPNVDFSFDEEGNLLGVDESAQIKQATPSIQRHRMGSQSAAGSRQAFETENQLLDEGVEFQSVEEGDALHPTEGESFPTNQPLPEQTQIQPSRKRGPRPIPMDKSTQLRNAGMMAMNDNYLANMQYAKQQRANHRQPFQARQNAAYLVLGRGLGGVGVLHSGRFLGPLAHLSGATLWYSLTGQELNAPRKRRSSERATSPTHKRARYSEPERGRGEGNPPSETSDLPLFDESIEYGREAPALPVLEEHSSQMPWNQVPSSRATSRQGSILRSVTEARQVSADNTRPSNSPLHGRSVHVRRSSNVAGDSIYANTNIVPSDQGDDIDDAFESAAFLDYTVFSQSGPIESNAPTQADSQWLHDALDAETGRFLRFVSAHATHLGEQGVGAEMFFRPSAAQSATGLEKANEAQDVVAAASFESLLPPEQHSSLVASQGFMHILQLASSGTVQVHQSEGYAPIWIGIYGATWAAAQEDEHFAAATIAEDLVGSADEALEVGAGV